MAGSRDEDGQHKCPRLKKDTLCLSDLPDEILLHILSLLPTKSVVATSLLSRRWQHLWNNIPNLQLHESPIDAQRFRDSPFNLQRLPEPAFNIQFMNFAERALGVRGGSYLVSFSFACEVRDDAFRIKRLISSAIRCNVEQLSLYLWDIRYSFLLPCCVFGCETLVKLDMETNGLMVRFTSSMVCLPRLKHLRLKRFFFADDKSTEDLLSHPLLEEMILSECYWDKLIKAVNVNSPKLQSLSIDDFTGDLSEDRQVCFLGHNLKIFCYKGTFPPDQYCISASTMQLREAQLLVQFRFPKDFAAKSYCKLVKCISRVQNLTLSQYGVNAFDDPVHEYCPKLQTIIPVFEHVTQLNLTYSESIDTDSAWLRMIFEKCPHLEHLNIMTELVGGMRLRLIPSNFLINLKKITVHSYDPCAEYDDAINVLLHSAPVLEEMVLHWPTDSSRFGRFYHSSEVATLERELNRRPKLSVKCRISLILELF